MVPCASLTSPSPSPSLPPPQNDPNMAKELGEAKGEFYRVRVDATAFKFVPKGAYRPPPPKAKGMGFMRIGHNKDV